VPAVLEKTFTVTEAKAALTASDIAIRDWLAPILSMLHSALLLSCLASSQSFHTK
jgi:hypothetical protein